MLTTAYFQGYKEGVSPSEDRSSCSPTPKPISKVGSSVDRNYNLTFSKEGAQDFRQKMAEERKIKEEEKQLKRAQDIQQQRLSEEQAAQDFELRLLEKKKMEYE